MTSGNSGATALTVRVHRWPACTSTLFLWTSVSFLRGRAWARANASRTTRSTPKAVLTLTSVAISCGVPTRMRAAVADVRTLGALTDDDEVDVAGVAQRRRDAGEQLGRTQVDVVVQREAQLSSRPRSRTPDGTLGSPMAPSRIASWPRISSSTGRRQRLARRVPAPRTEVVLGGAEREAVRRGDDVENLEGLCGDLGSDAVTGDDCEREGASHGRHPTIAISGCETAISTYERFVACRSVVVGPVGRLELGSGRPRRAGAPVPTPSACAP